MRYLTEKKVRRFEPAKKEWVAIVNVNGDIYNYGEAYLPQGYMVIFLGKVYQKF